MDKDEYFHRDGYDIHTEVPISISQAILGGTADVRTLNGEVEVKIPKGCQPDTKLMLRGKGIQEPNSSRKGHHVVHLQIQIPKNITARQEELLREFDKESEENNIGVYGRLAHAAESTFEKLFGNRKKKEENRKEEEEQVKGESSSSSSDDEEEKKAAAQ